METTETPGRPAAVVTALKRSEKEFVFASTKRMFALGAVAWAHSTSSEASRAQPALFRGSLVPPVSLMILKLGGAEQAKGTVERGQVGVDSRSVVCIHDRDRLPRSVAGDAPKIDLVDAVGMPDLRGGERRRGGRARGQRMSE